MSELDPHRYVALAPRPPEGTFRLSEVFPGSGKLELDVGFGRGMSVFERNRRAPQNRVLGVEIKPKLTTWVHERIQKHGLNDSLKVWAADIRTLLGRIEPEAQVQRAFVHFPDPWWKARHQKRMVVTGTFLESLAPHLAPGGVLYVQTDVKERADTYFALMQDHAGYTDPAWLTENPFGSISNREARAEEVGLPVYRMLCERKAESR